MNYPMRRPASHGAAHFFAAPGAEYFGPAGLRAALAWDLRQHSGRCLPIRLS